MKKLIPALWRGPIVELSCCSEGCRSGGDPIGGNRMQVGGAPRRRRSRGSPHPPEPVQVLVLNAAGMPKILARSSAASALYPTRTNRALDALLRPSIFVSGIIAMPMLYRHAQVPPLLPRPSRSPALSSVRDSGAGIARARWNQFDLNRLSPWR
jgi:hypothetical protein